MKVFQCMEKARGSVGLMWSPHCAAESFTTFHCRRKFHLLCVSHYRLLEIFKRRLSHMFLYIGVLHVRTINLTGLKIDHCSANRPLRAKVIKKYIAKFSFRSQRTKRVKYTHTHTLTHAYEISPTSIFTHLHMYVCIIYKFC